jgi:hypothetical protein
MDIGSIAILIPIIGVSIPVIAIWTKHQQKMVELRVRELEAQAAAGSGSNSALEERLRVIERIVTDKGYDLASQIEALRDAKKVEALLDSREGELRK